MRSRDKAEEPLVREARREKLSKRGTWSAKCYKEVKQNKALKGSFARKKSTQTAVIGFILRKLYGVSGKSENKNQTQLDCKETGNCGLESCQEPMVFPPPLSQAPSLGSSLGVCSQPSPPSGVSCIWPWPQWPPYQGTAEFPFILVQIHEREREREKLSQALLFLFFLSLYTQITNFYSSLWVCCH